MAQLTSMMVRALRGAPITVLVLMILDKGPMAMKLIRAQSGYSQDKIQEAIEALSEYGLVNQVGRYTWQAMIGAEQLALGMEEEALDAVNKEKEIRSDISGAGSLVVVVKPINQESSKEILQQQDSRAASSENIGLEELLDRHGMRNPARKRLLAANYAYDLVQAHLVLSENVGQAIYRIEHNWPVDREKWRYWLSMHCPDCENYRSACTCEPLQDEDEWDPLQGEGEGEEDG